METKTSAVDMTIPEERGQVTGGVFYLGRVPVVKFTIGSRVVYRRKFRKGQDHAAFEHYEAQMKRLMSYNGFQAIVSSSDDDKTITLDDFPVSGWEQMEKEGIL